MLERRLRIASGLVLGTFVTLHLLNHSLGIVSIEAMDAMRRPLSALWRSLPGTVLLYGAFLVHFTLALVSLYRRRTLRMPAWEATQITLGLLFVLLVAKHATAVRGLYSLFDIRAGYGYILAAIWQDPRSVWQQPILLLVAWLHFAFGLHFWLRVRHWYARLQPWLLAVAVLVPALALAGYVAGGLTVLWLIAEADAPYARIPGWNLLDPARRELFKAGENIVVVAFAALLGATLLARALREIRTRRRAWRLQLPGDTVVNGTRGQTVLEALRAAGVPHASVCGGRARCTTCRVRVGAGSEFLDAPGAEEARALARIGATANVRLACQMRPRADLSVTPLLSPSATVDDARGGGVAGREQVVTVLFVDLRGSTRLGETRLPYDVLFLLNRFFTEMSAALQESGGHYAQFNGDGLMALYGLGGDVARGCRDALHGAARMCERLADLNRSLADELPSPLRVGIGVHCGEAIVGTMGPPSSPIFSAIGDNVNIAARLEACTKELDCPMVISQVVAEQAQLDTTDLPVHEASIRGRDATLCVYAIADPVALAARIGRGKRHERASNGV